MIGSFMVDVLMYKNTKGLDCKIYGLCRNRTVTETRFSAWTSNDRLILLEQDIKKDISGENREILLADDRIDYVLHLASNTHPLEYAADPIGTIMTNIVGLQHMLETAKDVRSERFVFASSNEVYGQNRNDAEKFDENYCGYIDSNTLRAGYPESKRCGESLCQAYRSQKNMDIVIPRLTRTFGPTMKERDSKAISQFIKKAVNRENIVLKSAGEQFFSYTYVADAVSGLLTVMLKGADGEAYNIADETCDIKLKDLANLAASYVEREVVFEIPDDVEAAGYSTATKARLDNRKISKLGWSATVNIETGIQRTIDILSSQKRDGLLED